jgi:hypothetical protein
VADLSRGVEAIDQRESADFGFGIERPAEYISGFAESRAYEFPGCSTKSYTVASSAFVIRTRLPLATFDTVVGPYSCTYEIIVVYTSHFCSNAFIIVTIGPGLKDALF